MSFPGQPQLVSRTNLWGYGCSHVKWDAPVARLVLSTVNVTTPQFLWVNQLSSLLGLVPWDILRMDNIIAWLWSKEKRRAKRKERAPCPKWPLTETLTSVHTVDAREQFQWLIPSLTNPIQMVLVSLNTKERAPYREKPLTETLTAPTSQAPPTAAVVAAAQ